jgi:DNA polymerase-3 subunit delta'
LAKAINCQEAAGQACDRCIACRKIEQLLHPDVHALLPLPGRREKRDKAGLPEAMRTAVLDYLRQGFSPSPSNINIARDFIRMLQKEMAYAPTEAPRRIGLIFAAECIHPAGANSLLKILEEPPVNAIFILVSAAPERLLPTILSRCQQVPLQSLSQEELRAHLRELEVGPERLELAVRLGAGSVQRAVRIAEGEFDETRERVERFLLAGLGREDESYWSLLDEVGGSAERDRLEDFLRGCSLYLRDLWLMACGGETRVVCADRLDFLAQVQPLFQVDQIEDAAIALDRAFEHLWRNVSSNLVLADLWQCLRHPGGSEKLDIDKKTASA